MFKTACIGYFAGFFGFFGAALISLRAKSVSNRLRGALLGFSAGLLIAFVCFEMLPEIFVRQGLYMGIAGIVSGTVLAAYSDGKISGNGTSKLGTMLRGLPEGMALGSLLNCNYTAGLAMAAVIALHSTALTVSGFMSVEKLSLRKVFMLPFLLALPVGLGTFIGSSLNFLQGYFSVLCLASAGGVMIYVSCGEILPETQDLWQGRLTVLTAAGGFACGIFFTTIL